MSRYSKYVYTTRRTSAHGKTTHHGNSVIVLSEADQADNADEAAEAAKTDTVDEVGEVDDVGGVDDGRWGDLGVP